MGSFGALIQSFCTHCAACCALLRVERKFVGPTKLAQPGFRPKISGSLFRFTNCLRIRRAQLGPLESCSLPFLLVSQGFNKATTSESNFQPVDAWLYLAFISRSSLVMSFVRARSSVVENMLEFKKLTVLTKVEEIRTCIMPTRILQRKSFGGFVRLWGDDSCQDLLKGTTLAG